MPGYQLEVVKKDYLQPKKFIKNIEGQFMQLKTSIKENW